MRGIRRRTNVGFSTFCSNGLPVIVATTALLLVGLPWAADAQNRTALDRSPSPLDSMPTPSAVRVPVVSFVPDVGSLDAPVTVERALTAFVRIRGFLQRTPVDGQPAAFSTEVYLGYDRNALHVLFVAFDPDPGAVRARMVPRENIGGDDAVTVMLDTDADQRRAYVFRTNPRGIQWDALFTEGQGMDVSFDAVWHSEGRVTGWGYLVRMSIPFASLRFRADDARAWRVILQRQVARGNDEDTYWPHVSSSVEGVLTQSAELSGLTNISRGRNIQLIPYSSFRSFRALEDRAPDGPTFVTEPAEFRAGADVKAILADQYVLDVTANPDFSQVESDQPQVTVNQRFEVFFPERRPFFTENADFFRTPITLLFSRRIGDPSVGTRFTGKADRWALGGLLSDDRAPGRLAAAGGDSAGARAWFMSARVVRDLGDHSTLGAMYTGREFKGTFNRTGGLDARLRFDSRWTASGQVAASGIGGGGTDSRTAVAYTGSVARSDQHLSVFASYTDIAPDFEAQSGFVPRTDIRRLSQFSSYFFRPRGGALRFWGPELFGQVVWDHDGTRLDEILEPSLEWQFDSNTSIEVNYRYARERLRPADHATLGRTRTYDVSNWDIEFGTGWLSWLTVSGNLGFGKRVNFSPAGGAEPETGNWKRLNASVGLRPGSRLRIDNDLIWSRLDDRLDRGRIFSDWIVRTLWNWQWSRELSLRLIVQFERTATDSALTLLTPRRNLNGDLLITYRVNPWTAAYVGVNGNAQNIELVDGPDGQALRRTAGFRNDARQVFLKLTYLFRL